MITLPRTLAAAPTGTVTVIAGRLPLRSPRALPAIVGWTWRVRRALRDAPGVAGYAFAFQIRGSALWTVSAWQSRTDLTDFEHSDAHRAAKIALRSRLRPPTFAVWSCRARELPVEWPEVRRRITAVAKPGNLAGAAQRRTRSG